MQSAACTKEWSMASLRMDISAVEKLLRCGQKESCASVLQTLFGELRYDVLPSAALRQYLVVDIYLTAQAFAAMLGISGEAFALRFGSVDDMAAELIKETSLLRALTEMLEQCIEWRIELYRGRKGTVIENAKAYIQDNFSSEDISLNTVAMAVNLSSTYFSALFKRETGTAFTDYLNSVRINKAKELLCCTLMQISEIAYAVGYKDYRYFSQVFKKNTGQTPRDYQRKNNK